MKLTNHVIFDTLLKRLEKKNLVPDIVESISREYHEVEVAECSYDLDIRLYFGSNEAIYLSVDLIGTVNGEYKQTARLGTIRTLYETPEAMYAMAKLQADLILEDRAWQEEILYS